jgi:nitroimidazol reductase NimA-like FMN-containing flavoprotein (pyridoxamine 5'-phosphate oxidase superfamily)
MPGKKIEWMRANPLVGVQVDERGAGRGWQSVVVDGRYEELPDRIGHKRERDHAWSLLSKHSDWWEPGALKPDTPAVANSTPHIFFRILVTALSGREATD